MPPSAGVPGIPIKIKVLFITENADILIPESLYARRVAEYATLAGELHIVLVNTRQHIANSSQIGPNSWLYPTNSFSKLFSGIDFFRVVMTKLTWKGRLHTDLITAENPYWLGFLGLMISKRYKKRLQVQVDSDFTKEGFFHGGLSGFFKNLIAWDVVRGAVGLRVVSKEIADTLVDKDKKLAPKITVLSKYLDIGNIAAQPITRDIRTQYPMMTFLMLMHCDLVPQKNIELAIDITKELCRVMPRTGLVIVGNGPEKSHLMSYAKRQGIVANIFFEPETEDIYSYYKTANVVLVTSKTEDNGISSLEALACSCPVITSNAGVAAAILHDIRGVSFVCDRGDKECFVQKIKEFINAPGLREHFKLNALYYAREALGYDKEEYLRRYYTTWETCFHSV